MNSRADGRATRFGASYTGSCSVLLLTFAASVVSAAPHAHTVYPEPALPPGWASDSASQFSEAMPVRDEVFKVTLAVREQNMDRIHDMALNVSTPDSSTYGQYLTQAQIDEITAPTAADVTAVRSWLNDAVGAASSLAGKCSTRLSLL